MKPCADWGVPTGDRDDFGGRPTGPAMVREALGAPLSGPRFLSAVIAEAVKHGWQVHRMSSPSHGGEITRDPIWHPVLLLVRDGHALVAHVGAAGPSFAVQEWMSRLCRATGAVNWAFLAREGLGPVEAVLSRPAQNEPPADDADGRRRGD